ncbi:hypothetical protein EV426DRAFT_613796 [Tirmania nivea]|nr:hypothetical protein EV426DRAFT_613796 [Tirmania nivea]
MYTARTRSQSPNHFTSRPIDHSPHQDGYIPPLSPPHSAERPLHAHNYSVLPPPAEAEPRILFRSVDRNKNLTGNKISTSRCREDQMPSLPHPALSNASPDRLTETLPAAIPTGPKLISEFSADGRPPLPGGPWSPIQRYHLEKLLKLGCVTNTKENAQNIEEVWLKTNPERGGGHGFGLTRESVMRYIIHQSGRFRCQGMKRRHGRQRKWRRWLLENRGATVKGDLGTESRHGDRLEVPAADGCGGGSALATAKSASLSRPSDSQLPLTSTNHWSPPYVPQPPEEYEEKPWWKEGNSPLRPALSVLSTAPTPGVQEVLEAIRAVTANQGTATGKPDASFLSNSLTPRSNEPGSSRISQLFTSSINTNSQDLSIVSSRPVRHPFPITPNTTAHPPFSPPPETTHATTPVYTAAITTPSSSALSSTLQSCPPTHNQINSRSSTHLHLQIVVTRGQHHALLDQLLDMPGDITLHNSSLTKGGRGEEQMVFIRVEVPRDYQKFMMMMIGRMQGVREVLGMENH